MDVEHRFAPVAIALRDGIIEHYRDRGERLDDAAGIRTLDTNSTLAASRGDLLLRILERRGGPGDLRGLRVADLGCGFGSLSLYFAVAGADVIGVDPNLERANVAACIARDLGLTATFARGWVDDLTLTDGSIDVVVLNNSLCYVVRRPDRKRALGHVQRILAPDGWTVLRNPSRSAPLDPFTGLPLVHQLPPGIAQRVLRRRGRPRSPVRLRTAGGLSRELRRAGLRSVRSVRVDQPWWRPPRYQHHVGRRAADGDGGDART
jgi:2-polyprenyl-3-methyl-5-hydroxy-6-metoxy-1,4-benzoquinol methylase